MNRIRRLADLFTEIKRLEKNLKSPYLHRDMFNNLLGKMIILFSETEEIIDDMGLDRIELQKRLDAVFVLNFSFFIFH